MHSAQTPNISAFRNDGSTRRPKANRSNPLPKLPRTLYEHTPWTRKPDGHSTRPCWRRRLLQKLPCTQTRRGPTAQPSPVQAEIPQKAGARAEPPPAPAPRHSPRRHDQARRTTPDACMGDSIMSDSTPPVSSSSPAWQAWPKSRVAEGRGVARRSGTDPSRRTRSAGWILGGITLQTNKKSTCVNACVLCSTSYH